MDEQGSTVIDEPVWTGTSEAGTPGEDFCDDWGDDTASGTYGGTAYRNNSWTDDGTMDCYDDARLYCFEQ